MINAVIMTLTYKFCVEVDLKDSKTIKASVSVIVRDLFSVLSDNSYLYHSFYIT